MRQPALSLLLVLVSQTFSADHKVLFPNKSLKQRIVHNNTAGMLLKLAQKHGENPLYHDVLRMVEVSDQLGHSCIPGVLNSEDFISIAWVETRFDPYAIGAAKEVGIWQVWEWKQLLPKIQASNPFDLETNGKMACTVLRQKYQLFKTYKKTIQGYNGVSIFKGFRYFNKVQNFKKEAFPKPVTSKLKRKV